MYKLQRTGLTLGMIAYDPVGLLRTILMQSIPASILQGPKQLRI